MDNNMQDKVVVLTGASSGIGKSLAGKLAHMGAKLVLAARREERLIELQQEIREAGGEAVYQVTDVSKKELVSALMEFALQTFGKIDVLVNNAGVMPTSFLEKNAVDEWDRLININIVSR